MEHIDQSIATLEEQLKQVAQKSLALKRSINLLCETKGEAPRYTDTEMQESAEPASLRSDAFYGKPLNQSITKIPEMRNVSGIGPATVREIYDALLKGGHQFTASSEKNAQDGLRITLGEKLGDVPQTSERKVRNVGVVSRRKIQEVQRF